MYTFSHTFSQGHVVILTGNQPPERNFTSRFLSCTDFHSLRARFHRKVEVVCAWMPSCRSRVSKVVYISRRSGSTQPRVCISPPSTIRVHKAAGRPTVRAMAEYPWGSPYSTRLIPLISRDPSGQSAVTSCLRMTRSLSPGSVGRGEKMRRRKSRRRRKEEEKEDEEK